MKKAVIIILVTFFMAGCGTKTMVQTVSDNVTALEEEVIALHESVNALSKLSRELTEKLVSNSKRLDALDGQNSTQTANAVRSEVPTPREGPRIIIIEDDRVMPKSLYDYALELYNQKKYTESKEKFADFLNRFPEDALAANAQYWTGETYYALKDYRKALEAFLMVRSNYSKSNKVPDAILKAGYSYNLLGERNEAITLLNGLVRSYPDSQAATLAASTLSRWQ